MLSSFAALSDFCFGIDSITWIPHLVPPLIQLQTPILASKTKYYKIIKSTFRIPSPFHFTFSYANLTHVGKNWTILRYFLTSWEISIKNFSKIRWSAMFEKSLSFREGFSETGKGWFNLRVSAQFQILSEVHFGVKCASRSILTNVSSIWKIKSSLSSQI